MKLTLSTLHAGADIDSLASELAEGFGGDEAAAREMLEQTVQFLKAEPRPDPWGSYLARDGAKAVGTCAFKAAPDAEGIVEIAYMTFPAFQRRGYATAMIAELHDIAAGAGATLVCAHTLPEENASNAALRRNGFVHAGDVVDPEDGPVWRWEKRQ